MTVTINGNNENLNNDRDLLYIIDKYVGNSEVLQYVKDMSDSLDYYSHKVDDLEAEIIELTEG